MRRVRGAYRVAVGWMVVVAVVLGAASVASAVAITGFAYQGLGSYTELGDFYERGLSLPHARAIVPYDVVDRPTEMAEKIAWVQRMQARGRQVLISFNHNGAPPPDLATYGSKVTAFRDRLIDNGAPVPEFTAWNEPNHSPGSAPDANPGAVLAAQYWKRLNALCGIAVNGQRCVVTAGDFHDPNPTSASAIRAFDDYVAAYRSELAIGPNAATPSRWAIHPYSATALKDFSAVTSWVNNATGSADVWLTELGAMFCKAKVGYTNLGIGIADASTAAAFQNDRVVALKAALQALPARVTRAYYYTVGWPAGGHQHCQAPSYVWDSALLGDHFGYGDVERPAFRTLFPSAPTPQPPAVSVDDATDVTQVRATLHGVVDPRGLNTNYHFEYGTNTAYGSSAPLPAASVGNGSGAVAVGVPISGLQPNTTYHFRLVATSVAGTVHSQDRTFRTVRMPQPAVVVASGGAKHVFFRGLDGQLKEWRWDGEAWVKRGYGHAGAVVGDPAAVALADGSVEVFYRTSRGQMGRWWIGGEEWNHTAHGYEGVVAGDPAAVALGDGSIYVYYRTSLGQLGRWWFRGADWNNSEAGYQGVVAGDPSVVATGGGNIEVFYRTNLGRLGRWWFNGTDYNHTDWGDQNAMAGDPMAVLASGGRIEVLYRTQHAQLGRWWFEGAGWSHADLGTSGVVAGNPAAVVNQAGRLEVLFLTNERQLGRFWFAGADWNYTAQLAGGAIAGDPAAVVSDSGVVSTFFGGPDAEYYTFWYESSGPEWDYQRLQPAPDVAIDDVSDVGIQEATLAGTVNPRGLRTTYQFEFGTTTDYGRSVPISDGDAGSGDAPVTVRATAERLLAGTTYHYRLVARSRTGTVRSQDRTFRTAPMPRPSAVVAVGGGTHVFFRGLDGQLKEWRWDGSAWSLRGYGHSGAVVGEPAAVALADGSVEVFYRTSRGQMGRWWIRGEEWNHTVYGYEDNVAGDPAAVALAEGSKYVYFRTALGQLGRWWFKGSDWNFSVVGHQGAVTGTPAAVATGGGNIEVFYRTSLGQLGRWWFNGPDYHHTEWGGQNAVAGNPVAVPGTGGRIEVLYRNQYSQLGRWWFQGAESGQAEHGVGGLVAGEPAAAVTSTGRLEVLFLTTDQQLGRFWFAGADWNYSAQLAGGAISGDPAAVVSDSGVVSTFFGGPDAEYYTFWYESAGANWNHQRLRP